MRISPAVLAGALIAAAAFGQDTQHRPPPSDCSRWSVKGLRIGMTLGDVREAHKKLKHGRNWFRPDDRGREWYFWPESRMKGLYNYVLPERDAADAEIVSIMALLDISEASSSATVEALIERWGPPIAREVPVATVRYFNVFGAPRGEFDWLATTWEDPTCDILVTLLDKTTLPPVGGIPPFKEVTLSLDSISKLVAQKERELEKAREAVRP